MKKIIETPNELKKTIEYFNSFHDGFLKSLRIVSGNKFLQQPPWESRKIYNLNEEKLKDTGLMYFNKTGLFLEICHHNYDWPNKSPQTKILLVLSEVEYIDHRIADMVGLPILGCKVDCKKSKPNLIFTFEVMSNNKPKQFKINPLIFKKISVQEKSS